MLLFISILGIFLSVVLFFFNARRYTSTIYLAFFCLTVSLYSLNQFIILYSKSEFWISLVYTNFTFPNYLIGPMCYFYTRSVLKDDTRLKKGDFLHFLPMLVHLIASIPYIITPFSYKREIARSIISDPGFIGSFHATFLSDLFSNSAIYLSRPILALFYVIGSIALLIHYKLKKGKVMIFVRQHFMFKWLLYFLGFQLIVVLSHLFLIFRVFQNDLGELFFTSNWLQILSLIGLCPGCVIRKHGYRSTYLLSYFVYTIHNKNILL